MKRPPDWVVRCSRFSGMPVATRSDSLASPLEPERSEEEVGDVKRLSELVEQLAGVVKGVQEAQESQSSDLGASHSLQRV